MTKDEILSKLTSRKFWLAVAALVASIGTTLTGLNSGNDVIAIIGIACTALSAGIYAFAEAWTDAAALCAVDVEELAEELAGIADAMEEWDEEGE